MIDFHAHILPNIDDGSRSIDETFNLIKEAQNVGFDEIVLTPHYKETVFETDVAERGVWLDAITKNLTTKNIKAKLYNQAVTNVMQKVGMPVKNKLINQIYMTDNIIKLLENEKASTINNTSYVLFELPKNEEPLNLYDLIYEMQQNKIVPVLAHPERYVYVQKEPELLYDLVEKGVLIQANYGSIIGQYGNKAQMIVRKMFENNLVHFLGTDVHREKTIYKLIPEILEEIESIIGKERLEELTSINPKLALLNKRIDIRTPIEFKLNFKEKLMMNFNLNFLK